MKVLFVTHATDLTGANKSMFQLIKELKEDYGVEITVICPKIYEKNNNILKELTKIGIRCISHRITSFKRREPTVIYSLYFIVTEFLYTLHLSWILRNDKFDIIHSNSSVIDIGQYIAMIKKIPHIWHLREFGYEDFGMKSCLGKKYEKWIYNRGDKFIAISDVIKNKFSLIISPNKIVRVYNGISIPDTAFTSNHESNVIQFCIVGRVSNNKNQLEALKACSLLINRGIRNFHMTFVGRPDPLYLSVLKSFIQEKKIDQYVDIFDHRNNISEFLSSMDVGLMLSISEAFGRVTIEYMMHKLVVIASNTGANKELISDGETGLIYLLGDFETLSYKMEEIIMDRNKLLALSNHGYEYSIKNFNSKKNSSEIINLYSSFR